MSAHPILALGESLSTSNMIFLVVAIGLALTFEFVNGFHDTANAVATVIYTHTLPPWIAVIWSGCWNLIGVLWSNGAVAFSILALLPVELVINVGSGAGFAMIFALLISAILWNLGTWYLGLPASSSHTLIGSIMGVGIANAVMSGHGWNAGVNWGKAEEVFLSLLVSPIVGFVCAGALLLLAKALIRKPELFQPPPPGNPPPGWIRGILMLTCTGVSFAHGSNDGQKGMGLLLLILIGVLPAEYALNLNAKKNDLHALEQASAQVQPLLDKYAGLSGAALASAPKKLGDPDSAELSQYLATGGKLSDKTFAAVASANREVVSFISGKAAMTDVAPDQRKTLRTDLFLVDRTLAKLVKTQKVQAGAEANTLSAYHSHLEKSTRYLPLWIKVAVALALGCGTMIGWKRIVTTVGEKIGKEHLNYAQGASAELVAMATIGAADFFGMPVSTTHVLSSGIAGTMAANRSGLQMATLRNVLLAWVLTLPVCVLLGAGTFAAGLYVVFHNLVPFVSIVALGLAAAILARIVFRWMQQSRPTPSGAM